MVTSLASETQDCEKEEALLFNPCSRSWSRDPGLLFFFLVIKSAQTGAGAFSFSSLFWIRAPGSPDIETSTRSEAKVLRSHPQTFSVHPCSGFEIGPDLFFSSIFTCSFSQIRPNLFLHHFLFHRLRKRNRFCSQAWRQALGPRRKS